MRNLGIVIAIILSVSFGVILGRLSYAHVCTVTACNEDLDCKPIRNQVLTEEDLNAGRTELGFMEHGGLHGITIVGIKVKTYFTLEKINPYDWNKNQYFTGSGWSGDETKAMRAETRCELNNAYLHFKTK